MGSVTLSACYAICGVTVECDWNAYGKFVFATKLSAPDLKQDQFFTIFYDP